MALSRDTPIGLRLLGTDGLLGKDWLLIVLVASPIWAADEILKSEAYVCPPLVGPGRFSLVLMDNFCYILKRS